jgi:hypothetical protein
MAVPVARSPVPLRVLALPGCSHAQDDVASLAFSQVSITTLNLTNKHLLTDNTLTFGGVHWNNPFQIYAEVRYQSHY